MWLVTGGAGYIGSHVCHLLDEKSIDYLVIDNLSSGLVDNLPSKSQLLLGDIRDIDFLKSVFANHKFDGIINLAAKKSVSESFDSPDLYFDVNTKSVEILIRLAEEYKVMNFIQASTAAVYDSNSDHNLTESHPLNPASPYGESKLEAEKLILDSRLNFIVLRIFNVAGRNNHFVKQSYFEDLFSKVIAALTSNKQPVIFGDSHKTQDGTCERDFLHPSDISECIFRCIQKLSQEEVKKVFNLGSGVGFSVREIISEISLQFKIDIEPKVISARVGDSPRAIANTAAIKSYLQWNSKRDLKEIVASLLN